MNGDPPFEPPKISDEDIRWASRLLGLPDDAFYGEDCTDPRQAVLKSMETIDVAACPGSGKTTLLVAKLAILAEMWRYRTRGICVLSHTNAARHEIETRLGCTTVARRLLSYPHFIGTIHGFVNEFLAVPWLRSLGYPIKIIDTTVCLRRRWNALPHATQNALERNRHEPSVLTVRSPDLSVGEVRWGKGGLLRKDTDTYCAIRDTCQRAMTEGYFCYDEMFVWANDLMDKLPSLVHTIRDRFPLLFVDEAQDNSEAQSAILHRIFSEGKSTVIRQRLGDGNQAIFDFMDAEEAQTDKFPDDAVKKDLPNSHRFGQEIADLADPLGVIPYDLKGQGPKKPLGSGVQEGQHTIFLFDDDSVTKIIDAYAELLFETFSEEELRDGMREGTFAAVGQIHRPPGSDGNPKLPHHVGHYWSDYDPGLSKPDPKPQTFVQYVFAGLEKAETTGEVHPAVEKIAEGIFRLAGMAKGRPVFRRRRHLHRYVMTFLDEYAYIRENYEKLIAAFAVEKQLPEKEAWNDSWRDVVEKIAATIAGNSLSGPEVDEFLTWKNGPNDGAKLHVGTKRRDNIFRLPNDDPEVHIRIGSIHSIKGKTHMATMVCETFWYKHNLEALTPWITGDRTGWNKSDGVRQQTRLKVHYVAMTRPTHLLCLAMRRSTFETEQGDIDQDMIQKLRHRGWQVKCLPE